MARSLQHPAHQPRPVRRGASVALLAFLAVSGQTTRAPGLVPAPPASVRAAYAEKSIDIAWDSVPGAAGYHVYTGAEAGLPIAKRRRLNQQLITSGTHFTYIWDVNAGQRVRGVKGYRHHLVVTSVAVDDGVEVESGPSAEIDNCYFEGFDRADTRTGIERVLRPKQQTERLPVERHGNSRSAFVAFMTGPGARLQALVRDTIDPREVGACSPLATVLVQLMLTSGLRAWKVEGTFIREYHAFVVIEVDSVEYVVDFAADQFIPDVSPVVVPRDWCFLGPNGRFAEAGEPVYAVSRVYAPEQSSLVDGAGTDVYRWLLAKAGERPAKKRAAGRSAAGRRQ
jgi:hypothetical protein